MSFTVEEIMQKVAVGKPFTLLILFSGDIPAPDDEQLVNQLQMEHLAHLFEMESQGKSCVFGPVSNDDMLKGIIVFNTTDKDQIHQWMADDPWIKRGHLKY